MKSTAQHCVVGVNDRQRTFATASDAQDPLSCGLRARTRKEAIWSRTMVAGSFGFHGDLSEFEALADTAYMLPPHRKSRHGISGDRSEG